MCIYTYYLSTHSLGCARNDVDICTDDLTNKAHPNNNNMGSENQSRTNCIGGFRNSTVAIEGQLEGYRGRHINYFNSEVCTAGISKDTKKSIGNVKDRKKKHFGVPWQLVVARHHNLAEISFFIIFDQIWLHV